MNFSSVYERQKRNPSQMYHPMHNSFANYWTEAFQKREMKQEYTDEIYLNNLHLIPDPLKKNLADTLFTTENLMKPEKVPQQMPLPPLNMPQKVENAGSALGGIGSFFSGVLNVITGVMFRAKSPVNYYDCFDVDCHQGSPESWHCANTDVQDKNGQPANEKQSYDGPSPNVSRDMNPDKTVTNCESKLNQVLNLLAPKSKQTSSPVWVRKQPKKVFVDPGSVSESFEDAFSPEDFINLPDDSFIEYYSPMQYHHKDLYETAAQKTMLNTAPGKENMEIVKDVTNKSDLEWIKSSDSQLEQITNKSDLESAKGSDLQLKQSMSSENETSQIKGNLNMEKVETVVENCSKLDKDNTELEKDLSTKQSDEKFLPEMDKKDGFNCQVVSSCEDKLSKLKALLLEKRKKSTTISTPDPTMETTKTIPIEKKSADKRYKNPNRRTDKRRKTALKCKIEDDLLFANEISLDTPPDIENSPIHHPNANFGEYFDEVKGRFRSASIGSEDSFQIVFNESPKHGRIRTTSDCDSEDSFIVFEDSPESCYMSNDVFGDSDESDSDVSDSGCAMMTCKLAHSLTRTISNLADDSLYNEGDDEVDFGNIETVSVMDEVNSGLLLDDKKKQLRRDIPAKKVRFSTSPPKVRVMRVWAYAARQARAGHWERYAVDRERFKRRIADVEMAVSWVLRPQHRSRVMFQRFMPWWNQLKRKELAEKKEREEEKRRLDEEARKNEEQPNYGVKQENVEDKLESEGDKLQNEGEKQKNEGDRNKNEEETSEEEEQERQDSNMEDMAKLDKQKNADVNKELDCTNNELEFNNNQIETKEGPVASCIIKEEETKKSYHKEVSGSCNFSS